MAFRVYMDVDIIALYVHYIINVHFLEASSLLNEQRVPDDPASSFNGFQESIIGNVVKAKLNSVIKIMRMKGPHKKGKWFSVFYLIQRRSIGMR